MKFVQLLSSPNVDGEKPDDIIALADDGSVWIWLGRGEHPGWYDFETCERPFPKQSQRDASTSEKARREEMIGGLGDYLADRFLGRSFKFNEVARAAIEWLRGPL